MTEKRFTIEFDGYKYFCIVDVPNESCIARLDTKSDADAFLEMYEYYEEENEQLKFELKECREHKLFSRRQLEIENEQLKQQIKELEKAVK